MSMQLVTGNHAAGHAFGLAGEANRLHREFIMHGKLFHQHVAQQFVIIDQQDGAVASPRWGGRCLRPVGHRAIAGG